MSKTRFHFISNWHVAAPTDAAFDCLSDPAALSDWWPGFRTARTETAPTPVGRAARIEVRSIPPIVLRFELRIVSAAQNQELGAVARGDLEGSARVQFGAAETGTRITFDWDVTLERPWLRPLSSALRPLFVFSHELMMRRGERGLNEFLRSD